MLWIDNDISIGFYNQYISKTARAIDHNRIIQAYRLAQSQMKRSSLRIQQRAILKNFTLGALVFVRRMSPKETEFIPLIAAITGVLARNPITKAFDVESGKYARNPNWHWLWSKSTYICYTIKNNELFIGDNVESFKHEGNIGSVLFDKWLASFSDMERIYMGLLKRKYDRIDYKKQLLDKIKPLITGNNDRTNKC